MAKTGFTQTSAAEDHSPEVAEQPDYQTLSSVSVSTRMITAEPYTLPIGLFVNGQRMRHFKLKPFTGEDEIKIGALFRRYQGKMGEILPDVLASFVTEIDGEPIQEIAKTQSTSVVKLFQNFNIADAIQVLFQIRLDNFGNELKLSAECPKCGFKNEDAEGEYSDLSTLEIGFGDTITSNFFRVDLVDGLQFMGDAIDHLILRPMRVYDYTRLAKPDGSRGQLAIEHKIMLQTVRAIPQCTALSGSRNFDGSGVSEDSARDVYAEMTAKDRKAMLKAVEKLLKFGAEMRLDYVCRNCSNEFKAEVGWNNLPTFLSLPD